MRHIFGTLLFVGILASTLTLEADEASSFTLITKNEAVVSGVITEINAESFMLKTDEQFFRINIDDLDLDVAASDVLDVNSQVAVKGDLEGENFKGIIVIDAEEILMIGGNITEKAAASLLISDDGHYNE